jgi:hypothetical protein
LSDDENDTLNVLLKRLEERSSRNVLRASLYDGKHAARQVGSIIPPYLYQLGVCLGWPAKAVDTLARRCTPDSVVWPDGDLGDLGYQDFAEANQLTAQIKAAEVSSLIHGVAFLVNTSGDVGDGEPASLFHVKDAMNATGTWSTRKRRLTDLLSITSRGELDEVTGLVLYLDGVTITADKADGVWSVDRSEHPWRVPAEPMVYKPRTGRDLGSSRISRPLMSIHRRALREVFRMEGHMDIYSWPQMILLGADESIFKNADGTQKASWQIALGRIFGIPDDEDAQQPRADVKQFQAATPDPHLSMYKQLAGEFSGEASIPLTSLGVSDQSNPTSADSYLASREDLIAEAEGATDDWSVQINRAVIRGLAIQNGLSEVPPEWSSMAIKFRNPRYLSRSAQADAGAKQLGAVPWLAETEVGLELLGLDSQQIARALAEKRRIAGRQVVAAALAQQPAPVADAQPE